MFNKLKIKKTVLKYTLLCYFYYKNKSKNNVIQITATIIV